MKIEAQIDFFLIRCWNTADLCGILYGFVFAIFFMIKSANRAIRDLQLRKFS